MKVKNICCIGAGYVGGPTMAVIALECPDLIITVVDKDSKKIDAWNGDINKLPVYEPGLKSIIKKVRNKNLFFSNDIAGSINNSEMIFMAVNTPTKTEGVGAGMAADLKYVESCARDIAKFSKSDKIVIEKSTLPVRTAEKIKEILNYENNKVQFEVLSNPEFLAEGTAIKDLYKSDRVLIGGESTMSGKKAIEELKKIYLRWIPKNKIFLTNVWSSELAKLASNAMLAQRISSINSLSALSEKTGARIEELSVAIGLDHRIGPKFLQPSPGFGGSCFQKDILNLVYLCRHYGLNEVAEYWHQVIKINDYQKNRFANKIINEFNGDLKNIKIAILGWAFKSNTNDSRESPSIYIAKKLLDAGGYIKIYDPMVTNDRIFSDLNAIMDKETYKDKVIICNNINSTLDNVNSISIITEWDEFKNYDWKTFTHGLKNKISIYDGRNILLDKLSDYPSYFKL